ncbi:AfsR/SARP family transcriptional regulator [Dactylosporangium darangshiense]|uniref:AfsR/SARP family transcriptional regulator n=1 Tax=Dactylosporangium darangshiense TaxID=579108 RepID=UPI00363FDFE1
MLGELVARDGDRELDLGPPLNRQLLAALLAHVGEPVPAGVLAAQLWPALDPAATRKRLQIVVHRLRRVLGRPDRLRYRGGTYTLVASADEVDALTFAELIGAARGTRAGGDLAGALTRLEAALRLWRGPAYADVGHGPRVAAEADRLAEERLLAIEERVSVELGLGRGAQLVAELRGLVADHPYREVLAGQLMLALFRADRQAAALEVYRQARAVLVADLGVEPGAALQQLQHAILRRDPDLAAPAPAASIPRALPHAVAGFAGRERDLAALDAMLPPPGETAAPLVISALSGMAGVGKTALAVQWAQRVAHRFPDGQLYLNLSGYSTAGAVRPAEALTGLLRMLGVPPERVPADVEAAAALYRSTIAGRRMLVLLDNARSAEQVRPLLPGAPGGLVLITSRAALGELVVHDGARRVTLDVLGPGEALELLGLHLGRSRVDAERDAAAELAELCAYLPLALRVAAAAIADRSCGGIARYVAELRTRDPLAVLVIDGDRPAVRAAFDLSYRAEEPATRRVFRLFGLVPGPDVTVAAMAALAGAPAADARRHLDRLVSAHLIQRSAGERYSGHDLLRSYARERALAEDDEPNRAGALVRLLTWYLTAADEAARLMYPNVLRMWAPPPGAAGAGLELSGASAAAQLLDAELPNVIAAIRHAAEHGPASMSWLLADAVRGYLGRRGHIGDWFAIGQAALDAAGAAGDPRGRATAHLSLANAHYTIGEYDGAEEHMRAAVRLGDELAWEQLQATGLANLGAALSDAGRLRDAVRIAARARSIADRVGLTAISVLARNNAAYALLQSGRPAAARAALEAGLEILSAAGLPPNPVLLDNLASAHALAGRYRIGVDLLTRAIAARREHRDVRAEAKAMMHLANILGAAGRGREALDAGLAAAAIARDYGDRRTEATALVVIAATQLADGRTDAAGETLAVAAEIAAAGQARLVRTVVRAGGAEVSLAHGAAEEALALAGEALADARANGFVLVEGQLLTLAARARLALGDVAGGVEHARRAVRLRRAAGHRLGEVHSGRVLADALQRSGEDALAGAARRRIARVAAGIDAPAESGRFLFGVG